MKSIALSATTSKLAEPIKNRNGVPILQFGGEATSLHYFSTVHGAIESGWREAKRLIDLYRYDSLKISFFYISLKNNILYHFFAVRNLNFN